MSFFELDDVFGYQDANEIKKLWAKDTAPSDPGDGEVWLDTAGSTYQLKRYNGTGWDVIAGLAAAELLNEIKTVDGSDSGLDADKLDGQEGSFYQNASNLDSGTIPADRLSAGDLLTKITTVDGSGSGLDADKLDGQEGSDYQNASNLNTGTLSKDRLPTETVRTDQNTDVGAHTEWQDTYQARFGNGADLRIQHSGSGSYIDNHNGDLSIRQLSHGNNINVQAENDSGATQTLLTLDPDTPKVVSCGSFLSKKHEESIAANGILVTDLWSKASGILIIGAAGALNAAGLWMLTRDGVSDINEISAAALFTNTKDTAGKINIYYESGTVNIQNKTSVTQTVWVGFFGVR